MQSRLPLVAAMVIAALACGDIDIMEPVSTSVAAGIVADEDGTPVPGGLVHGSTCQASASDAWLATADSIGRYRLEMSLFPAAMVSLCVRLIADPPPGTALGSDTAQIDTVVFSGAGETDSIQVDFVLGSVPPQ